MVREYPIGEKNIDGAVAIFRGRYPTLNRVVNLECQLLAYVIKGSGIVVVEGTKQRIDEGDLILIESGEKYYWKGNMEVFMACSPAWSPEQYKIVE